MWWRTVLGVWGILPAAATFYFFVFWSWFDFWRKHRSATYLMLLGWFVVVGGGVLAFRRRALVRIDLPVWVHVIGWVVIAGITVFGTIADRQIGIRVRSFTPFFERAGRVELKTTGAYGVVRHPIYAAGSAFQIGIFLVTGFPAVLVAWAVFTLGALWFTRQEEERLMSLLDDPNEYVRYRERVPALFPRITDRLGRR